jgi:hypothetical protein
MDHLARCFQDAGALSKLVGGALSFTRAIAKLPAISKSEAAALIRGETGTGKELVARAIHYINRAGFPFVAITAGRFPTSCWRRSCSDTTETVHAADSWPVTENVVTFHFHFASSPGRFCHDKEVQ